MRESKEKYYLRIASMVSIRSTCLRRNYGAVIVKNDRIVSTGYNGAPRGCTNCNDTNFCIRKANNVAHNSDYTDCVAVHAEQNAIIHADYNDMQDATLYLAGYDADNGFPVQDIDCCPLCKRMIINAGISKVIFQESDGTYRVEEVASWRR